MTQIEIAKVTNPSISIIEVETSVINLITNNVATSSATYVQNIAGAMFIDTASVNFTYNNIAQTISADVRVDNSTIKIDGINNYIYSENGLYNQLDTSGVALSGTEPDPNRVLTLSNTVLTKNLSIFMDGAFLHPGVSITVNHLATNTTITFLGNVWNSQAIRVIWYE